MTDADQAKARFLEWAGRIEWRHKTTVVMVNSWKLRPWETIWAVAPHAHLLIVESDFDEAQAASDMIRSLPKEHPLTFICRGIPSLFHFVSQHWTPRTSIALYTGGDDEAKENALDQISRGISTRTSEEKTIRDNALGWTLAGLEIMPRLTGLPLMTTGMEAALDGRPAIVVGAGPSLDLAIDMIRRAEGRALIIAANSSVGPLEHHGIVPDIICAVESKDKSYKDVINTNAWRRSIFVGSAHVHPMAWDAPSRATLVAPADTSAPLQRLFDQHGIPKVITGGTVTALCYMLAVYLGCRPVVLAGTDLAYGSGYYAEGVKHSAKAETEMPADTVEAWGGGDATSHPLFIRYRHWFEAQAKNISAKVGVDTINTSVYGARIKGTIEAPPSAVDFSDTEKIDIQGAILDAAAECRSFAPDELIAILEADLKASAEYADLMEGSYGIAQKLLARTRTYVKEPCYRGSFLHTASMASFDDYLLTSDDLLSQLQTTANIFEPLEQTRKTIRSATKVALSKLRSQMREAA